MTQPINPVLLRTLGGMLPPPPPPKPGSYPVPPGTTDNGDGTVTTGDGSILRINPDGSMTNVRTGEKVANNGSTTDGPFGLLSGGANRFSDNNPYNNTTGLPRYTTTNDPLKNIWGLNTTPTDPTKNVAPPDLSFLASGGGAGGGGSADPNFYQWLAGQRASEAGPQLQRTSIDWSGFGSGLGPAPAAPTSTPYSAYGGAPPPAGGGGSVTGNPGMWDAIAKSMGLGPSYPEDKVVAVPPPPPAPGGGPMGSRSVGMISPQTLPGGVPAIGSAGGGPGTMGGGGPIFGAGATGGGAEYSGRAELPPDMKAAIDARNGSMTPGFNGPIMGAGNGGFIAGSGVGGPVSPFGTNGPATNPLPPGGGGGGKGSSAYGGFAGGANGMGDLNYGASFGPPPPPTPQGPATGGVAFGNRSSAQGGAQVGIQGMTAGGAPGTASGYVPPQPKPPPAGPAVGGTAFGRGAGQDTLTGRPATTPANQTPGGNPGLVGVPPGQETIGPGGIPMRGQFSNPVFQQQQQTREKQVGLLGRLERDMNGEQPSLAQLTLRKGVDENVAAMNAIAASGGPGGYAAAARQAAVSGAKANQDLVGQAAALRAQEYQTARQEAGQLSTQLRINDLTATGMSYDNAVKQAQLEADQAKTQLGADVQMADIRAKQEQGLLDLGMRGTALGSEEKMHLADLLMQKYGIDKGAAIQMASRPGLADYIMKGAATGGAFGGLPGAIAGGAAGWLYGNSGRP